MGINWDVQVSMEYCVPIKLDRGVSFWYMLKRLAEYEPGYAKRAHDATVTGEPLAKALQKRAAQSIVVLMDSPEYCRDEAEKEVENPTPLEERFHYNPDFGLDSGENRDFDLALGSDLDPDYENKLPYVLGEAFKFAASKILGEGHGLTLTLLRGGKSWTWEEAVSEKIRGFFMKYEHEQQAYESGGYVMPDHRGSVNVPWGVQATTVPAAPAGVAQKMKQLMSAFGLEAVGDPAWRVITVADIG